MSVIRALNRALRALLSGQILNLTNPLTSRERFASRRYLNRLRLAFSFTAFALLWSILWLLVFPVSILVWMLALGLGYLAALGVVWYYYIALERRPIRLRCRSCQRIVSSNTPWICPSCHRSNLNPIEFPFVHKCENPKCGAEPKTYRCHYSDCQEFIFLTEDEDRIDYAYRVNSPVDTTESDIRALEVKRERENKRDEHVEKMVSTKEELDLVQVRREIARVRQQIRETQVPVQPDSLEAKVRDGVGKTMEGHALLEKLREEFYRKHGRKVGELWYAAAVEEIAKLRRKEQ